MNSLIQIKHQIHQAWAGNPVEVVCNIVVDMLTGERGQQIRIIDVSTLERWTNKQFSYEVLMDAVLFLSGRAPHLLDIQYVLTDENDEEHSVTREDIRAMRQKNSIPDPYSGDWLPVQNPDDYISCYFRPSEDARKLLH